MPETDDGFVQRDEQSSEDHVIASEVPASVVDAMVERGRITRIEPTR